MQAMNCLIVEDESLAATVIADYIRQVPGLHLVDICESAEEAGSIIHQHKIDLIFLDINLPGLSGMDFIKTLKSPVQVILITAYHEHALDAFRLNVTDYLLKPVDISSFLQSVDKALERFKYMQSYPMHKIFYVISERKKIKIKTESVQSSIKILSETFSNIPHWVTCLITININISYGFIACELIRRKHWIIRIQRIHTQKPTQSIIIYPHPIILLISFSLHLRIAFLAIKSETVRRPKKGFHAVHFGYRIGNMA